MWIDLKSQLVIVYPFLTEELFLVGEMRGAFNHVVKFVSKKKVFVLRVHIGNLSYDEMNYAVEVQRHICKDLDVGPVIYPASDGEWVANINGNMVVLMDFVQGASEPPSALNCKYDQLGVILGRLHSASLAMVVGEFKPSRLKFSGSGEVVLGELESILRLLGSSHQASPILRMRLMIIERLIDRLDLRKFTRGIIHGDFHGGNLIIDDAGDLKGVLDFDQCGEFYYMYEFFRGFFLPLSMRNDYLDWQEGFSSYVQGYIGHCRFDRTEVVHGVDLFLWTIVGDVSTVPGVEDSDTTSLFVVHRNHLIQWLAEYHIAVKSFIYAILN